MILEIISINLSRNKKNLFKNFNLMIKKPELINLVGKNGCGKTSLLEMIVGLLKPDKGKIKINNLEIQDIGEQKRREFIYIPYDDSLKGNLTIEENLKIWTDLAEIKWSEKLFYKSLKYFYLEGLSNVVVGKLSRGQRKKVSLMKLMFTKCKLWLLDEPFNSLDKDNVVCLKKLLSKHLREGGTVVLASHIEVKLKNCRTMVLKQEQNLIKNSAVNDWDLLR